MSRKDGRLEPGQKLSGAISARAWNRAQDAADLVLGQQGGMTAGDGIKDTNRLVIPVRVVDAYRLPQGIPPGTAIRLQAVVGQSRLGEQPQSGTLVIPYGGFFRYEFVAGYLTSLESTISGVTTVAVSCDGSSTRDRDNFITVPCVVSGMAVVRVRVFSIYHGYAVLPFRKSNETDPTGKYTGILDSSPCACGGSVRVVAYDVQQPSANVSPGDAPIGWAAVIV